MATHRVHSKLTRRIIAWAAAVATVGAVIVGGIAIASSATPTAKAAVDMRGNQVTVDAAQVPTAAHVRAADIKDGTGERFEVPSVGLDVPLGALNAVEGTITPPGFTSAYWVRNMGVPMADADKGTVFIVMHSVRGGGVGPGNYLIDVPNHKAKVKPGSTIEVAGNTYKVDGSEAVPKGDLPADQSVWANIPNRLVIITCLQVPSGSPSQDNMVITATRVTP